jgi:ATP-dependent exoDNAse (exonuclease V) beta subunit
MLKDAEQRHRAIDPRCSCLVRAPAGSGKTELLIQRYLALLAGVEQPEQILAMTFTRKAAAEMRHRILAALDQATIPAPAELSAHARITRELACAALARDAQCGWNLRQFPDQLAIQTIDSFNASLVRRMPWLSRLGALPQVQPQPQALYRQAVAETLHLHHEDAQLNKAVARLVRHLDNRTALLEDLLVDLLQRRDQWLRHLSASGRQPDRAALEAALCQRVELVLTRLWHQLDGPLRAELQALMRYAAEQVARSDSPLANYRAETFPEPLAERLADWQALAELLLTAAGQWRRRLDKNGGFPPGKGTAARMKERMTALLAELADRCPAQDWQQLRQLPPPRYSDAAAAVLEALWQLLPALVARLWLVFARHGQIDFCEMALRARQALVEEGQPTDLLLQLDDQIRHILVDEFQDTSWLQFDLLERLTVGWSAGDGRSLFVVGDPMQSIYRFREAQVGLFLRAGRDGIGPVRLESLQLCTNFRAQQQLVDWTNRCCSQLFPRQESIADGAVSFSPSTAALPPLPGSAVAFYPQLGRDAAAEAQQLAALVGVLLQREPHDRLAILVRARSQVAPLLRALQQAGLPCQVQDLAALGQRPLVMDFVLLLRALLLPGDRLSLLALLRSPLCGLELADLTRIGQRPQADLLAQLQEPELLAELSPEGQARLLRLAAALAWAEHQRGLQPLYDWVRDCWDLLAGSACYPAAEEACLDQLAEVLDACDQGGDLIDFARLDELLQQTPARLAAPLNCRVSLMTIHKAKGLEFDQVLLPGLGLTTRPPQRRLLSWQEDVEAGLLLAPLGTLTQTAADPVYALLERIEAEREAHEQVRLLYVALTRARKGLHLFGHLRLTGPEQSPQPAAGSLLQLLWPAVEKDFLARLPVSLAGESAERDRLPSSPETPPGLWRRPLVQLPAPAPVVATGLTRRWQNETGEPLARWQARQAGTLLHQWLALLAQQPRWQQPQALAQLQPQLLQHCRQQGFADRAEALSREFLATLQQVLASERGAWLLQPHPLAVCEQALAGWRDGEWIEGVVDRSFVDASRGERLIVDYKSAVPASGESHTVFYARQLERYGPQLERYLWLYRQWQPQQPCRAALYFPLWDGWCEYDNEGE